MADRAGQQLGNYRLQRLLGEGGFAEVYLGEHVHLKTQSAIKVLSAKLSAEEIEDFRDEAQTLAHLKHPNIVKVLDFGVEGSVPFLVMDYAVNGTLRQRYPKGTRLSPADILPYVRQVASALHYAHERKLIHRDVKPENMLVGESGEVLLSDFGIAIVAQSSRYQNMQNVGGTLAYMAPEQIQGKPRPASDQYSLGIVIYEWLCGERPFHGAMNEVVAQHLSTPPQPLREKLPTISSGLEQVVLTALEKDPKERFASIQAFANAFEQACQSETSFLSPSVRGLLPSLQPIFVESSLPQSAPETDLFAPPSLPPSLYAQDPSSILTPVAVETASSAPTPIPIAPSSPKQAITWTQGFTGLFVSAAIAEIAFTLIGVANVNAQTGLNPNGDLMGLLVGIGLVLVSIGGLRFASSRLMRVGFVFLLLTAIAAILEWVLLLSFDANPRGGFPIALYSHLLLAVSLLNLVSLISISYALVRWQPVDDKMTVLQLIVSGALTALFWNWFGGIKGASNIEYVAIFVCAAFPATLLVFRFSCWKRQPVVILCLAVANTLWTISNFRFQLPLSLIYALLLAFVSLSVLGFLALARVEQVKKAATVGQG